MKEDGTSAPRARGKNYGILGTDVYRRKGGGVSIYRCCSRRAVIRITGCGFVEKLSKLKKENRHVNIKFTKREGHWIASLTRAKIGGNLIQTYIGLHPVIQIVVNSSLPKLFWKMQRNQKKTITFPLTVEIAINEWREINITSCDFLLSIEKETKSLLAYALRKGFTSDMSVKGRAYDLFLADAHKRKYFLAITTRGSSSIELRRKEMIVQKVLLDIAKLLTIVCRHRDSIPVIISRPIDTKKTWSYTTKKYLDFYKDTFKFRFLTTNFGNGWEKDICEKLKRIA